MNSNIKNSLNAAYGSKWPTGTFLLPNDGLVDAILIPNDATMKWFSEVLNIQVDDFANNPLKDEFPPFHTLTKRTSKTYNNGRYKIEHIEDRNCNIIAFGTPFDIQNNRAIPVTRIIKPKFNGDAIIYEIDGIILGDGMAERLTSKRVVKLPVL